MNCWLAGDALATEIDGMYEQEANLLSTLQIQDDLSDAAIAEAIGFLDLVQAAIQDRISTIKHREV